MAKKTKADFVQYYSKLSHDMQSLENAIDNHIYLTVTPQKPNGSRQAVMKHFYGRTLGRLFREKDPDGFNAAYKEWLTE